MLGVRDSPKPPPLRLTLTYPVLNAAKRAWLVLGGEAKAQILADGLSDGDPRRTPFAGVRAVEETLVLTDRAAAGLLPAAVVEAVD